MREDRYTRPLRLRAAAGLATLLIILSALLVSCAQTNYSDILVTKAFDGDTLRLANGEKVRLIGIDSPELYESDKLFRDARRTGEDIETIMAAGRKSYKFTKELVEGKMVRLEFDVEKRDKYGRLLAYVFISNNQLFLNAEIIKQGYADIMLIPPNVKYADYFQGLYQEAKENKRAGAQMEEKEVEKMKLTSPEFKHNGIIPGKFTSQGDDINPALIIEGLPNGAKSLALIVDDPDAPMGTWVHWVVYNIPVIAKIDENSIPGTQGSNDFGRKNYGGPCPPSGTHRYFFKLYGLDAQLDLPEGITKEDLEKAMEGHILDKTELIGLYKRH